MTIGNNPKSAMSSPSSYLYTSPDGVWENSTPYAIMHEAPIGTGLWSSVYLATPRTGGMQSPIAYAQQYIASASPTSPETPPATPVRRRGQSNSSTDSYMTQFSSSTAASTATQAGVTSELTATSGGHRPLSSPPPPPAPSAIWAIKAPADRAAFSVIRSEARMLTHIFSSTTKTTNGDDQKPSPTDFMVPFLGLDPRSGGLLMQALPLTLEDLIRGDLASFGGGADGEAARARLVASLFPRLAARLLTGLQWLHEDAGVVHADVKPSNILLRPAREGVAEAMIRRRLRGAAARLATAPPSSLMEEAGRPSLLVRRGNSSRCSSSDEEEGKGEILEEDVRTIDFEPLYTDFSAAIPIRPFPSPSSANDPSNTTSPPSSPPTTATAPPPHLAGGTWDFLAPELCRLHPAPAPPSPATDVYALGVTLLCVVVGESPFEALAGGNAFRKREMVKCGDAVGFAREVPRARFARVKGEVGKRWRREDEAWDWERWMRRGLVKKAEMRAGAKEWRRELEGLAAATTIAVCWALVL
ncbi:hypothetical protein BFW01_g9553 [Lasiodiplodia theobromae]|nr:hypothetical protein BFW01_g9553 [Lasiodiplodia theobromae]